MKKALFLILMLAICAVTGAWATDDEPEEGELIYYGDYAFSVADGQATIVYCNGSGGEPGWDNEEEPEFRIVRPGMEDESARFPKSIGADGVWRFVVPATLCGHPVVAIGGGSFSEGAVWGDVILPEGLTSIGHQAFYLCTGVDTITVPASVTSIGEAAFGYGCSPALRVVEGSCAAQYAQENGILYTFDMDYTVYQSGPWLYTVVGGVATLDGYVYNGWHRGYADDRGDDSVYIDLVFPDRLDGYPVAPVKSLPLRTFDADNLGSIAIPASVTEIVGNSFTRSGLTSITVSPDNPIYEDIDGVLFDKRDNTLAIFPVARYGDYAIPEGTATIGDEAFYWCDGLTSVTIPDTVASIGKHAFRGCKGFTSLTIPATVTFIGEGAFDRASWNKPITLTVTEGSYAEQYALDNNIPFTYTAEKENHP